jgi:hypothetical protein
MNGRKKEPWRRPPKANRPQPAPAPKPAPYRWQDDPTYAGMADEPAKTSPGTPERRQDDRRPDQGANPSIRLANAGRQLVVGSVDRSQRSAWLLK